MTDTRTIASGSHILLHFALSLEDGTEVVSTFGEEPMQLTLGDGSMEPALERQLMGLKKGDEQSLLMSGNDVYGEHDRKNCQWISRSEFPSSLDIKEGQVIAFTSPNGDELGGVVMTVEEARVLIDFNHPLSGKYFIFKAAILQVDNPE